MLAGLVEAVRVRQLPGRHAADAGRAARRSRASDGTTSARSRSFLRDRATVVRWFTGLGLELVEPGLVQLHHWRPGPADPDCSDAMPLLGAVARKP